MPDSPRVSKLLLCSCIVLFAGCSGSNPRNEAKTEPPKPAPVEYFKVDPATAGVVSGRIRFTGARPAKKAVSMDEDPQCAKMHGSRQVPDEEVVVNGNGTLQNVFVYLKTGLEGKVFEPPSAPVTVDQKGCWFYPRVLGMQTGQSLKVLNSDPVTHNIHPLAKLNREWNHSQGGGDPPVSRRFVRPEVMIRVKCNIHGWMRAWIGVVDNPYFAVSGADGAFALKGVPPGTYTIAAWQEKFGTQEQSVTVPPSGNVTAAFTFKGE